MLFAQSSPMNYKGIKLHAIDLERCFVCKKETRGIGVRDVI